MTGSGKVDQPPNDYRWCGIATVVVALLLALVLVGPIWGKGFFAFVPHTNVDGRGVELQGARKALIDADTTYVVASIRANAIAIARGREIFEREWCAPEKEVLALSDPLLAAGVVAIPGHFLGSLLGFEPHGVAGAYNSAILGWFLLKALAISLLLFSWTGSTAAGIAGGVTYAFNAPWMRDPSHFYIYDHSWILFALFFSQRFLKDHRWSNLALVCVLILMQLANCFYATLAAAAIALPLAVWMMQDGRWRLPIGRVIVAVSATAIGAYLLLKPYIALESTAGGGATIAPIFASPEDFLPGGLVYPGIWVYVLALIGLCLPARLVVGRGGKDPRLAIAVGIALCAWLAVGPQSPLPDIYGWLASVVPGLGSVRGPTRISAGAWPGLAILVGMSVAGTLRILPAALARLTQGLALVAIAALALSAHLISPVPYIAPQSAVIEAEENSFFDDLKTRGLDGPLFELPHGGLDGLFDSPRRMLLSTNHRMRTSACYSSAKPPNARRLAELSDKLPNDEQAIHELWKAGFRTILVHPRSTGRRLLPAFDRAVEGGAPLRQVAKLNGMKAYEIVH